LSLNITLHEFSSFDTFATMLWTSFGLNLIVGATLIFNVCTTGASCALAGSTHGSRPRHAITTMVRISCLLRCWLPRPEAGASAHRVISESPSLARVFGNSNAS
jgi:hypothetical protein